MKIIVFGTGGIGGYFGGRLAQAGEDVTFIARGPHLAALQQQGLQVQSIKGDFTLSPVQAADDPGQVKDPDVVLVCVKAWQVPEVARALLPVIGAHTLVVPLQNGVDAPEQLASVLDKPAGAVPHVAGGLCRISAQLAAPGLIRHVGIEPSIAFGALDGRADERIEALRLACQRAGLAVEVPADIYQAMWTKFTFIAAISGVGAVTRSPVGVFRQVPETRQMLINALDEIVAVGRARGVALPADTAGRTLSVIDNLPPGTLASMHRDVIDGRPSELEAQNGAVVRMGRELGIPTPTHAFIYHSLLPQEAKARGTLSF